MSEKGIKFLLDHGREPVAIVHERVDLVAVPALPPIRQINGEKGTAFFNAAGLRLRAGKHAVAVVAHHHLHIQYKLFPVIHPTRAVRFK